METTLTALSAQTRALTVFTLPKPREIRNDLPSIDPFVCAQETAGNQTRLGAGRRKHAFWLGDAVSRYWSGWNAKKVSYNNRDRTKDALEPCSPAEYRYIALSYWDKREKGAHCSCCLPAWWEWTGRCLPSFRFRRVTVRTCLSLCKIHCRRGTLRPTTPQYKTPCEFSPSDSSCPSVCLSVFRQPAFWPLELPPRLSSKKRHCSSGAHDLFSASVPSARFSFPSIFPFPKDSVSFTRHIVHPTASLFCPSTRHIYSLAIFFFRSRYIVCPARYGTADGLSKTARAKGAPAKSLKLPSRFCGMASRQDNLIFLSQKFGPRFAASHFLSLFSQTLSNFCLGRVSQ